jgi:hypothetical protein
MYTDGNGCSASATDLLTINPVPTVNFYSIVGAVYADTPPFDLMGNVNPIGGTFIGDGMTGSIFSPANAGAGTHMITYTYAHPITGCSASQIQYIPVGPVGLGEFVTAVKRVIIYPNPATTTLSISGINVKQITSLSILSLKGEVIYTTDCISETMKIDVSQYGSTKYIISFTRAIDRFSFNRYFLKE